MPPVLTDEHQFKILRLLENDANLSQRDLARSLGVSVGKVNYCLKALIESGLVKANNFKNSRNKKAYMYLLTRRGLAAKAGASVKFLQNKMAEFDQLHGDIARARHEYAAKAALVPYGRHFIDEEDIAAVVAQMRTPWLTQGPKVPEFEAAIAEYVGAKYAVAMSSGTSALHMACLAAGVGPGDRAITSPISFAASANCAVYTGAEAEFVDIDRDTLNMSPERLRERLARGPAKAVIPVHFAGLPCEMDRISELSRGAGAVVIEDAAHALGSRYRSGSRVGSCAHSDMAVFSFHPVKSIASGEGGLVTTNREDLYRRLLRLRSHGINKLDDPMQHPENAFQDGVPNRWYYEMQELGHNCRMTDIQAALGLSQMRKIDRFLARRAELAARYRELLAGTPFRPAQSGGWGESANHLFVVRTGFGAVEASRTAFMQRLYERGYATQVHYIPIPMHPFYARRGCSMKDLPEAADYYRECLSIPLYYGLEDAQQRAFLAAAVEVK